MASYKTVTDSTKTTAVEHALARSRADAAATIAKLRQEIARLRAAFTDLANDDSLNEGDAQDLARAVLEKGRELGA